MFEQICPEGAQQNSPGQSEVAFRHERRPGKGNTDEYKALKGRNKTRCCAALSGLGPFSGMKTQGVAGGEAPRRFALG